MKKWRKGLNYKVIKIYIMALFCLLSYVERIRTPFNPGPLHHRMDLQSRPIPLLIHPLRLLRTLPARALHRPCAALSISSNPPNLYRHRPRRFLLPRPNLRR